MANTEGECEGGKGVYGIVDVLLAKKIEGRRILKGRPLLCKKCILTFPVSSSFYLSVRHIQHISLLVVSLCTRSDLRYALNLVVSSNNNLVQYCNQSEKKPKLILLC
ncbi:unnamed protein product [Ectocarpus sp. 12 AP-2014]